MIVMDIEKLIRIVGALSESLSEGININQAAKKAGVSIASAYRILKKMESGNIIEKRKSGNNIFYRLNLKNSIARKYAELSSIRKREKFFQKKPEYYEMFMNLKDSIKKFSPIIGLFGSLARMEEKPGDIDILVVYTQLKPVQAVLSKSGKFSPFYITEPEFKKKIREPVIAGMIKDIVVLYGECEFWNMVSEAI